MGSLSATENCHTVLAGLVGGQARLSPHRARAGLSLAGSTWLRCLFFLAWCWRFRAHSGLRLARLAVSSVVASSFFLFQYGCKCGKESGCELRCWCGSLFGTSSRAGVTWRETKVVASSLDAVQSHVELASSLVVSRANESFSRSSSQRVVLDDGTELRYDTGFALQFRGVRIFNVRVTQFWTLAGTSCRAQQRLWNTAKKTATSWCSGERSVHKSRETARLEHAEGHFLGRHSERLPCRKRLSRTDLGVPEEGRTRLVALLWVGSCTDRSYESRTCYNQWQKTSWSPKNLPRTTKNTGTSSSRKRRARTNSRRGTRTELNTFGDNPRKTRQALRVEVEQGFCVSFVSKKKIQTLRNFGSSKVIWYEIPCGLSILERLCFANQTTS